MATHAKLLEIAARINQVLVQEIGQGIQPARLIREPRYARDVLLVCDACGGTELPLLAREFRRLLSTTGAAAEPRAGHARQRTEWSNTSTGFGVTDFGAKGFVASMPLESRPASGTTVPGPLPAGEPARPGRRWWQRWSKR
jgi:hypothetical protein